MAIFRCNLGSIYKFYIWHSQQFFFSQPRKHQIPFFIAIDILNINCNAFTRMLSTDWSIIPTGVMQIYVMQSIRKHSFIGMFKPIK